MPRSPNQRLKLLYVMKILMEKTDEENPLTVTEIISTLATFNITAERKSIYSDIELLRQFGVDIVTRRDKAVSYYVANRNFELPELKLLVDAVQSSRFITNKKSETLIKKLSSLASREQAKQLNRQVLIAGRAKPVNETIYYIIDKIHTAINFNKKISFNYYDYDFNKKQVYRKSGALYRNTPVSLCWNEDKYYLIAYNSYYDDFANYRVDRMANIEILDEESDDYESKSFNAAEYAKRVFGMFDGETVHASLLFHKCLVNAVIDRFGNDINMKVSSSDDEWVEVSVDVSISPVFLAWIFQFGSLAAIENPEKLINAMQKLLEENTDVYFDN